MKLFVVDVCSLRGRVVDYINCFYFNKDYKILDSKIVLPVIPSWEGQSFGKVV